MFVTPRFRRFFHGKSGKKELGAYRNVEKRGNFRLQARKSNFLTTVQSSIVSNSKVRVTHKIPKKSGYYVVAEGDDLKEMREGPWAYVTSEDFTYPENLSRSQLTSWIVGHFTQLAMEQKSNKNFVQRSGAEMVQRARQARGDMMKSLKLAYQKVDSEMKSMLGTRINTRHVSLMVLFAFSLALLRRDATIFISILTAINTLYLVAAGNGVIDVKGRRFSIGNVVDPQEEKQSIVLSPVLSTSNGFERSDTLVSHSGNIVYG